MRSGEGFATVDAEILEGGVATLIGAQRGLVTMATTVATPGLFRRTRQVGEGRVCFLSDSGGVLAVLTGHTLPDTLSLVQVVF